VIRNALLESIRLVFIFSALLFMSPRLTGIVFLGIVPAALLLAYFAKRIKQVTRRQKKRQDVLSGVMNESLGNVRLVKALSTETYECDKFDEHNDKLFFYEMERRIAKFAASPIMEFFASIGLGAILILAGYMVIRDGEMDPSGFMVYLAFLASFYAPLRHIAKANVSWQQGTVSAQRIQEVLALQPSVTDPDPSQPASEIAKVQQGLAFENVTFRYKDKIILDSVSLSIGYGKTTAIVGRSGSGKSTVANLMLRLYDPDEGSVHLDGVDLRSFRLKDLRSHFGIVTQETLLFNDSVLNNIAYGCGAVDMDRAVEAAKAAHAHDFIMELDGGQGYQTEVGPAGCQLSGGQRQRIAIARAFYRDPEVLILDEATSSLDTQSEAAVQDALEQLMQNRTVVVISHRLSTIRNADTILVMEDGKIVEQGSHAELLARGGYYTRLCKYGELTLSSEIA
jgi:subfamily B ATP-binding cassette protein MsbA